MFIFQNKLNKRYVRRLYQHEVSGNAETYEHVDELDRATIFAGWWEIVEWMRKRKDLAFPVLPKDWEIISVRLISQPKIEIVESIG